MTDIATGILFGILIVLGKIAGPPWPRTLDNVPPREHILGVALLFCISASCYALAFAMLVGTLR